MTALEPNAVTIEIPAVAEFVSVLRMTASAVASRAGFTLEEIDDLRIAVDEAASLLLSVSPPGGSLRCRFEYGHEGLVSVLSVPISGSEVSQNGFSWLVLKAVSSDVVLTASLEERQIALTARRGVSAAKPVQQ